MSELKGIVCFILAYYMGKYSVSGGPEWWAGLAVLTGGLGFVLFIGDTWDKKLPKRLRH